MFDPGEKRLFGLPPGVDFPAALVAGLEKRLAGAPPEAWARVTLIVNTRRMARRLREIFDAGPPRLLPRMMLITDMSGLLQRPPAASARSALRRRLDLIALVRELIEVEQRFALHGSLFDLTDSLAALLDEMEAEGVAPEVIADLDVTDESGHWARTQAFVGIARTYLDALGRAQDVGAQARAVMEALLAQWRDAPPPGPIVLAGSTGSRAVGSALIRGILDLPQGAVVLPGFDFHVPAHGWDAMSSEDHPQHRFLSLARDLGAERPAVRRWHDTPEPASLRNQVVSLSLRPAPATDAWLDEGPMLPGLGASMDRVTIVTAESARDEAQAIALRLRQAAEEGKRAALISPDRMLTRQVTSALGQWGIVPDDSAGTPLHLTPPGRFLRHVAQLFARPLDGEALLTLLKHPLTCSTDARGAHQRNTQQLELAIRAKGLPYPDASGIARLATDPQWAAWVGDTLCAQVVQGTQPLKAWVAAHLAISEALANGGTDGAGTLWLQLSGIAARAVMDDLAAEAGDTPMTAMDYGDLVGKLLAGAEVRDRDAPHPDIMIWGTIEARVQGADLVILGGMNDGIWPTAPAPDPWLNRTMRKTAGLLLPERRIGLSAHDFQQAIGAPEVWITRSVRADGAETVPSRWINRLQNLLCGLSGGQGAWESALDRGEAWLAAVRLREAVADVDPAQRPSPRPPVAARPRGLRVTEIKTLKRDPYALYARHCLGLSPLGPLTATPDALLRGNVLHDVMERFVRSVLADPARLTEETLRQIGADILARDVPWPAARHLWQARLDRISAWFVQREAVRQSGLDSAVFENEANGVLDLPDLGMQLRGRADRIDLHADGGAVIYDYKSGCVPSEKEQIHFDRQLLIEAVMLEQGSFSSLGPRPAHGAVYIGLGSDPKEVRAPLEEHPPRAVLTDLRALLATYLDPDHGFTARRALHEVKDHSDYDSLSRFGEWDVTRPPKPETLQ